jgi:HAD superfamily hydrolase (TIGR01549 family)
MGGFLEAYFSKLGAYVSKVVDPDILLPALLVATKQMVANRLPNRTLQEEFDVSFFPAIKQKREELQHLFDTFYQEVFPTIKNTTKAKPEAVEMVEEALSRGYRVGIATNPLFPRSAIVQRLSWAGLPEDKYPFILIPSYETFHFSKPNPAYFIEFLANIGRPDEPVLMVGDDLINDIVAAKQAGIATYWLNRDPDSTDKQAATANGDLRDLIPWLDSVPLESLEPDYSFKNAVMANLAGIAAAFDTLGRELPGPAWTKKPNPEEWCLAEIMCHLRDVEAEVNLPRLRKVISESNPFIPGRDTDPWANERQYILQDCLEARDSFLLSRIELLSLLGSLDEEQWQRPARHAILGPTQVQELAGIIASHDRLHIQQAHQVLAAISQKIQ